MRPGMLAGLVAAVLLAVPAVAQAQRGGMGGGGRSAGPSGSMSFSSAAPRSGSIRHISSFSVPNGSSAVRPHANPFSVYGAPAPYRFAGSLGTPALGIRAPRHGGPAHGNNGGGRHYPQQPRGTNPGFYFLTGGGYWYAGPGPGDDSAGQPMDAADQQDPADQQEVTGQQDVAGQQADDQQPLDDEQQNDERNEQRDERRYARGDDYRSSGAPQQQEAPQPPDVGSFTLVMRDGTQVDALAFTRAQDKIIYITPDGGRRAVAASDVDSDSTKRVNEDRGTPLQLPL